ncbi:uncharacterized protein PFL1_03981 [Pseudozyma flocculosa PF-1]|uniref:Related to ROT1 - molecular chaperone in the endoplasmic reticulum n=2 Tax=Pseudozyma flocculosa TaxID=84751 RepID=A0A5C3EXN4_9BASI|nr:uncharacterized protein PFL1_03981 [Pseudozyma flocculosa PF-1]EPQ28678.1 hypothetical protein PFL1_03981 [Pseudozyma flocculosa PF-1]SPO36630.1 related to ROT1 - molecular chaperone in the endoplasmic reticulum [Pseudozyma flocculosa]
MIGPRLPLLLAAAAIIACLAATVRAQGGIPVVNDPTAGDPTAATADGTAASDTGSPNPGASTGTTAAGSSTDGGLTNVTSLAGTWSSGSMAVETGLEFFNPISQQFKLPKNSGISYSFTDDGFFEQSKYRFESNPKRNRCFKASLIWQHGRYTLHANGSLTLQPFGPDGYIQVLDPCAAKTQQIYNYDEWELIPQWYNYLDGHLGFPSDQTSNYALQLFQFDGAKMPMMWLKYRPPTMLPTQQLFMKVLNG